MKAMIKSPENKHLTPGILDPLDPFLRCRENHTAAPAAKGRAGH